jgi:hypothetical protein
MSEILGDYHIHYVDKLNIDTILIESSVQVVHKSGCELALDITDLADFNAPNIVSDCLLALLSKEFFQLVGSEIIKELLAVLLAGGICADVEGNTDIH